MLLWLSLLQVLFLHTREQSPDTAILLTSSAGGYIYAWSVSSKGGMLGKFRAVHGDVNAVVGTMSTDSEDFILLTGDSLGYIKVIALLCLSNSRFEGLTLEIRSKVIRLVTCAQFKTDPNQPACSI